MSRRAFGDSYAFIRVATGSPRETDTGIIRQTGETPMSSDDKKLPLDVGKLKSGASAKKQLEPRKIFTTLKRDVKFKRPLDEQADVLDAWFEKRSQRDNTLKMNTGS